MLDPFKRKSKLNKNLIGVGIGNTLAGWVAVQLVLTPYFWLQPVVICLGLLILVLTLMPATIKYFTTNGRCYESL